MREMWVSREEFEELKKKVADLERITQSLQQGMLLKICSNSVMKEQYNFELLKFLFEKLDIEVPKSEYKFVRPETSPDDSGKGN